jgi:hypothetical protein
LSLKMSMSICWQKIPAWYCVLLDRLNLPNWVMCKLLLYKVSLFKFSVKLLY